VIADLKPYPEYKESGLPWLGRVPGHWEVKRAKSIFQCIDERSKTGKEELLTVSSARGDVQRKTASVTMFKAESYLGYKLCWPGDLVINSLWAWAGGLGVSSHHGIISSACGVYRIRQNTAMTPAFVHEVVRSSSFNWELKVRSKGVWISRLQLTDVSFLDAPMHIPPPTEQAAIVRFLDWANGRLERAIRAKRKVIALLTEQKQAIIHRAVTRGLDPSVPLKPSGIPWLGDIPQHWGVVRNMALFSHRVEQGIPGLPVLQVSLHSGITSEDFDQFGRPKRLIADHTKYKLVRKHDLAYNTMRMWQGAVGVSASDGLVSPAYVVIRPRTGIDPYFYEFVFRTAVYKQQVNRHSTGIVSDRNRLYWESFKQMPNVVLPVGEQQAICRFIQEKTGSLNTAITRLEREIELLREYRTRLVADVVTGKFDVREVVARLPEEAGEVGLSDLSDESDLYDLSDVSDGAGEPLPEEEES
jgi:type I restriction enzyme S subunit